MTSIVFFFHNMEVNGDQQLFGYAHFSEYFILCSTEERSWTGTWGRVNDDNFHFGVNYPFKKKNKKKDPSLIWWNNTNISFQSANFHQNCFSFEYVSFITL